jgi:hypothetical protein
VNLDIINFLDSLISIAEYNPSILGRQYQDYSLLSLDKSLRRVDYMYISCGDLI